MGKATATRPKHLPLDVAVDAPLARTEFKPSEEQQSLLAYMQGEGYDCTIVEACAACNVGRRTYYDWTDIEAFSVWWRQEAKAWEARQLPRVVGALVKGATSQGKGASVDRKTYFERNDPSAAAPDETGKPQQVSYNNVEKIQILLIGAEGKGYHPEYKQLCEQHGLDTTDGSRARDNAGGDSGADADRGSPGLDDGSAADH